MTLTIPVWLAWSLGGVLVLLLALALTGLALTWVFKGTMQ